MDKIRTFIAIELPPDVKATLADLHTNLSAGKDASAKWVNPNSIHLTLKFLGNINPEAIPQITDAMTKSAKNVKPFSLQLNEIGAFPNARSPRVVWVGLKGDTEILSELQKHLERSLDAVGFPPENRAFSPHLTLGRVHNGIRSNQRQALSERLSTAKLKAKQTFHINSIELMKSELTPKGAIYTKLAAVNL
ncbi:RNA 2',3'-cyclic phosphodiesterase [Chloroflexota bacterium]